MKLDFREIANKEAENAMTLLPVIEKEILHYDILRTMSEQGFLEKLTFQGGTSLRLCYNSERLSEDLDFTGGTAFTTDLMEELKQSIETSLSRKYGLEVVVKEPKAIHQEGIAVSAWQVKVETSPGKSDIPKQMIKIEVANVPSYTRQPVQLIENYQSISGAPVIIQAQDMKETMVDKILAFPMAKNIRYRDIWDLNWMARRGVDPQMDLLEKKINDYSAQNYQARLQERIEHLPELINGAEFRNQMSRFLRQSTIDESLDRPDFVTSMTNTVQRILSMAVAPTSSNRARP